ncbi:PREDICTED: probable disease resistance protein At4g19060 isoform X2 [Tarenaya hassleriana]|uniref:probable disease resistance protein At4g19060 isoform X1 n=1 Tax=Tarenaya hassleriana TaxID=28532 RepID=UPI00053C763C|nr:PREDICTED: probable disease resistance protein At4g19060 isoform X1 [Tarenaya hassleriana]XP_010535670.1 PREDICTED: probable disease resistance protein At4g19060 isoform X2 [Tarenaya hassleriana]
MDSLQSRSSSRTVLHVPVEMAQENRSHDSDLSGIKTLFGQGYETWLKEKLQFESHSSSRKGGSTQAGASAGNHAPPIPNGPGSSSGPSEAKRTETTSKTPGHEIRGFKNEILSLKSFLLNQKDSDEFKTLAVVGRYGVGKTALCQKIFNDESVKNAYVPRIWVSMYRDGEKEDSGQKIAAVKRLLESLGVEGEILERVREDAAGKGRDRDEELARLLYLLYLSLWGKKYLIVLDDVREEDEWEERLGEDEIPEGNEWGKHLSCGFPKGSGGRVIMTSREEELAKKMAGEEHGLHRIYPISDPAIVYDIYKDAAKENSIDVNPRNERKYIRDVMNKSCGIPLAARMLGKNQPVEEHTQEEDSDSNQTQ